ncbi:NFACT RNA binding domain-containing protein [Kiritimatiellota bacterium B12222]|nr:NFACT RNA binding domain-containing protein [Kiritimatiellota bacterium B12222]
MKMDYRQFELDEGWVATVGRSDRENDELSFKVAFPQDYWLHAKGCPGSHVILHHLQENEAPKAVLEAAARLALQFSKAKNAKKGAVSVAKVSDLAKAKGAPAGQVILRKSKTIQVYVLKS